MLDYSGALEDISQALALAPNYPEVMILKRCGGSFEVLCVHICKLTVWFCFLYIYQPYVCQGDVYVAQGQYDLAEKSYLKCLEIDPTLRRSKSFKVQNFI